mgnify:CR=1 FL=1
MLAGESMEIRNLYENNDPSVVVLGAFDGLHRGHLSLLKAGKKLALKKQAKLAVMTFDEHPDIVLRDNPMKLLTTQKEKLDLLEKLGVEIVFMPRFRDIAGLSAECFFYQILLGDFKAKGAVVGPNFRFGKKARGNSKLLNLLGQKEGLPVLVRPGVTQNGQIISSTLIRRLIRQGEVSRANTLLGRRYSLTGTVIAGEGRGRKLGMPTANLQIAPEKLLPPLGVYLVQGFWQNKSCYGLLSISDKPTFHAQSEIVSEVYFFDLNENLYGQEITLECIKYLRGIVKYSNANDLMDQVKKDEKEARNIIYFLA